MNFPLPRKVFDQNIAVLGKTRSGKSTMLRGGVEDLLRRNMPVCIIDPKGDWWGLKLAPDGKGPGFPIVIFGGEHADVPINSHAGAHVAELFATGNRPCLIDLKGWMPGDRTKFWIDFASSLFKHTKGLRWLVVDEAHNFAPKGKVLSPEAGIALHWSSRIASEGLGMGLHLMVASQRPQKVHNDVLTSCETLVAMKVLHPSDRDAVTEWLEGGGDPALTKTILGSLRDLQRGEGWAWSPEAKFGPERLQFPMFSTYDSFKPQDAVQVKRLKGWASVDLDEVTKKLAAVVEAHKANDPKELRAEIAQLKGQIATAATSTPEPVRIDAKAEQTEKAFKRGTIAAERARSVQAKAVKKTLDKGIDNIDAASRMLGDLRADLVQASTDLGLVPEPLVDAPPPLPPVAAKPTTPERRPRALPQGASAPGDSTPRVNGAVTAEGLSRPQQRILDALAELAALGVREASRIQVVFLSGYGHPNSKGFVNSIGALSSAGYVTYPRSGTVALTETGASVANHAGTPLTSADLQRRALELLGNAHGRILQPLIDAYPAEISRQDLCAAAGYGHMNSKGFVNAIGRLRTLGFIDYPSSGQVAALPTLFVE